MSEHYEMVSSQESSTGDSMDNGGGLAPLQQAATIGHETLATPIEEMFERVTSRGH